jgi:hypothetical protein
MARHIDTVGILWIVYGVFQLLVCLGLGLMFLGVGGAMGLAGASGGDDELAVMGGIYAIIGPVIMLLVGVFAILEIAAGMGIRRRAGWGRILGFVNSVLSLSSMPLGTALGIFTFVVLLDKDAAAEFDRVPET